MQRIPSYREILGIAIPIMIGSVSESVSAVVDIAFMGKLGTLAIDGMGMTTVILMMFMLMGLSFSRSIQILVSQNYGAGNYRNIGQILYNGFWVLTSMGLLMGYVLYFWSDSLLWWVIRNQDIHHIAHDICRIRALGFPLLGIIMLINSFYTGLGKTKILMYSQSIGAIANIILNYILVFGRLGGPALGYRGSAIATLLSELIILVVLILYIALNRRVISEYYLFYSRKLKWFLIREISDLAYPMLILHLFSLGSWIYFFSLIEKMGEKELAVSMVIKQIFISITIPGFCLATTANTLVGQLVGSRKVDWIVPTIFKVVGINYMILLTLAIGIYVFRMPVIYLFTADPYVIVHITDPLIALLTAYIFIPFSTTIFNSISALGNTRVSLLIESSAVGIYLVYLYISLSIYPGGLVAGWFSELVYWFFLLLFSLLYFYLFNWRKNILFLDKTE